MYVSHDMYICFCSILTETGLELPVFLQELVGHHALARRRRGNRRRARSAARSRRRARSAARRRCTHLSSLHLRRPVPIDKVAFVGSFSSHVIDISSDMPSLIHMSASSGVACSVLVEKIGSLPPYSLVLTALRSVSRGW
jgi:hypothetical protein